MMLNLFYAMYILPSYWSSLVLAISFGCGACVLLYNNHYININNFSGRLDKDSAVPYS